MQTKVFMPEAETQKERLAMLHATADAINEGVYYKPLTEDELNDRRTTLADVVEKQSNLQDEKAELVKDLNEQIKAEKVKIKDLLLTLKTRQEERHGTTYHLANYETGMLEIYDENGELIQERRLRPDEKQKTIMSAVRSVNG